MARLVIQYINACPVLIDGEVKGMTNSVIHVRPGVHTVTLDDEECEPCDKELQIPPETGSDEIMRMNFDTRPPIVDRLASSLYCRYNGFMLGQFMVASFARYARREFPPKQSRMQEFLNEIGAGVAVPDWRPMDSRESVQFTRDVLDATQPLSHELTSFTILSSALMHWSLFGGEGEASDKMRESVGIVVREKQLPEPDLARFIPRTDAQGRLSMNSLLYPSLSYLRQILNASDIKAEADTAFVVMPFSPPFDSYYTLFYRPALEAAGFRAMRAWGGLSGEHYVPVLQQLLMSSGLVLADVSKERLGPARGQRNPNVLYEIGVARACGKRVIIVVDEADKEGLPANICDAVTSYSPQSDNWPEDAIDSCKGYIHIYRATLDSIPRATDLEVAIDVAVGRLGKIIIPQEARGAYVRAIELYQQGDYEAAECQFSDAIDLGQNATEVHFFRSMNRFKLSRFPEAEQDLDTVLGRDDLEEVETKIGLHDADSPEPHAGLRATALFYRGYARQMQGKEAQAQEDYTTAQELGFPVDQGASDADSSRP